VLEVAAVPALAAGVYELRLTSGVASRTARFVALQ